MGAAWNRGMFKYDKKINIALVMVSSGILIFTTVLWEGFGVPLSSLFDSMNIENKLDQVLSEIGEKSFGIYLIHMVIINLAYKLFKFNPFTVSFAMGGMILVIVNLALSYMMVTIMKYLPGIKKII